MAFRSNKTVVAVVLNVATLIAVIAFKNSTIIPDVTDEMFRAPAAASKMPKKLLPFTTDGCSNFPDGEWVGCCVLHDLSYWKGGTRAERKAADQELGRCVAQYTSKSLGDLMTAGTRVGGAPSPLTSYGWGYGWNYSRSYGALSDEELKQVNRLMPATKLPYVVRLPPTATKVLTALDQDRRQKSITEILLEKNKRVPQDLFFVQVESLEGRRFQVFEEACPETYYLIAFSFTSEKVLDFKQVGECSLSQH